MAETDQTAKAQAQQKADKKAAQAKAQQAKAQSAEKGPKKPRERSDYVARLKTKYEQDIRPQLTKERGYTNPFQVPKITKIVLNMGIGEGVADRKKVDNAAADLTLIAGQKAVITNRASRSRPTSCAMARRSAPRSRFARRGCMIFSTAW